MSTPTAARRAHRALHLAALLAALAPGACRRAPAPAPAPVAAPARDTMPVAAARDTTPPWPRGEVRAATFWSPSLGVAKRYRVWLPPAYARDADARWPVAFYLHGLTGDEDNWFAQGGLARALDSLVAAGMPPMIVVTPDGDDGWWTTWNRLVDVGTCRRGRAAQGDAESYCVAWTRYDEYVARDLVAHVDSAWRTRPGRAHRAVAGLSMGGYGAVSLALRYPDVFAAAASHSGTVSMLALPGGTPDAPRYATSLEEVRAVSPRLVGWLEPAFGRDTIGWWARDPARLARAARARGAPLPALYLDAGVDDGLVIQMNRALHHELGVLGVAHEWHERPGRHDWSYWRAWSPTSLAWIAGIIAAPGGVERR